MPVPPPARFPRVLMLLNRYLPVVGGAERQAATLAGEFKRRGYPLSIVTRRIKAEHPPQETINDIPVRRLSPVGLSHVANALIVGRIVVYLIAHARDYDILHIHGVGPVGLAGILAARLTRKPVIVKPAAYGNLSRHDHSGITPSRYTRLIRRFILPPGIWKGFLQSVDRVIAISHEIADDARAVGLGDRVIPIPNGVDIRRFHPATPAEKQAIRHELGLPAEAFIFLFSGRLVRGKRLDVILHALAKVVDRCPDCLLVLAGSGSLQVDDVEAELKDLCQSLKIADRVLFVGLVDNVDQYLQAADAFLFPSEKEGMPNVVLEAMASGLPIIASEIEGVVQLLDDSSGWLVPVGDVDGFARALRELLSQPDLARAKGQGARQAAETRFSLQAVADQYEAVYAALRRK